LELCRAAEAQSCAQLRDGQLSHCEAAPAALAALVGMILGMHQDLGPEKATDFGTL